MFRAELTAELDSKARAVPARYRGFVRCHHLPGAKPAGAGAEAAFISFINVFGGFIMTKRMLAARSQDWLDGLLPGRPSLRCVTCALNRASPPVPGTPAPTWSHESGGPGRRQGSQSRRLKGLREDLPSAARGRHDLQQHARAQPLQVRFHCSSCEDHCMRTLFAGSLSPSARFRGTSWPASSTSRRLRWRWR